MSKASSIIEFELNFGKIKNFTESKKKIHVEDCFRVTCIFVHSDQHCLTSGPLVFSGKKSVKIRQ